ncbi:hypothetical protein KBX73_10130 [Acetobacter persici]|uniref:hypothetical protein n=1 Tax=Acetobacter persici TaxID=1076596 RepID=UPI0020CBD92E|nr:hypothetical protein [Acetobacter persici]MCP9320122.1 hypothetical protein [Acetobacter persici]
MAKIAWATILSPVFGILNAVIPAIAGSKMKTYSSIAQAAVKSAVVTAVGGVDKLQAAFDKFEADNPVVAAAVSEFTTLAKSLGFELPTEDAIVVHLKAAVTDLAGTIMPQTSASEPVPSATTPSA